MKININKLKEEGQLRIDALPKPPIVVDPFLILKTVTETFNLGCDLSNLIDILEFRISLTDSSTTTKEISTLNAAGYLLDSQTKPKVSGSNGEVEIVGKSIISKTPNENGVGYLPADENLFNEFDFPKLAKVFPSKQLPKGDVDEFIVSGVNERAILTDTIIPAINNGETWTRLAQGLGNGTTDINAIHHITGGIFITISDGGFANITNDGGLNWTPLVNGLGSPEGTDLLSVASDLYGKVMVGLNNGYLNVSNDYGVTWTLGEFNTGGGNFNTISVIHTNGKGVWVAVGEDGHWAKSVDNGEVWTRHIGGFGNVSNTTPITAISTDRNGVWVFGFSSGEVCRSTDELLNWVSLPNSFDDTTSPDNTVSAITNDFKGTWIACSGDNGHVVRSTDNGLTWNTLPPYLNLDVSGFEGIRGLFVTTDSKGTWIVGLEGGYVSISSDGGRTWSALDNGLDSGISTYESLTTMTTDGAGVWLVGGNSGRVASAVSDINFRSGRTWLPLPKQLTSPTAGGVEAIGVSLSTGVIIVAHDGGYYSRSDDGGLTWSPLPKGLNATSGSSQGKYLGTDDVGNWISISHNGWFSISDDDGLTWTALNQVVGEFGPISGATNKLGVWISGQSTPSVVGNKFIKSLDNGLTWSVINGISTSSVNDGYTHAMGGSKGTGTLIITHDDGSINRSTDNGVTWSRITDTKLDGPIYSIDSDDGQTWLMATLTGDVSRSSDDGITWTLLPDKLGNGDVVTKTIYNGIASDKRGSWLVTRLDDENASISINNGLTWEGVSVSGGQTPSNTNYRSPKSDGNGIWIVNVGFAGEMAISTPNLSFRSGLTWSSLVRGLNSGSITPNIRSVVTDGNGIWVAGMGNGFASRSTDNGVTWEPLVRGLNAGSATQSTLSIATDGDGTWVVGFTGGFASKSTDNGVTWSALPRGLNGGGSTQTIYSIATDGKGTWVAVFTGGYASRSVDNGVTWSPLPRWLDVGSNVSHAYSVATDGNGTWVAGMDGGYASRSTDNGVTWEPLVRGLNVGGTSSAIMSIATDGKGVWVVGMTSGYASRSTDNGVTWGPSPQGLDSGVINYLNNITTDGKGTWVAAMGSGYASRSVDNGLTWSPLVKGLNGGVNTYIYSIATDGKGTWVAGFRDGYAAISTLPKGEVISKWELPNKT